MGKTVLHSLISLALILGPEVAFAEAPQDAGSAAGASSGLSSGAPASSSVARSAGMPAATAKDASGSGPDIPSAPGGDVPTLESTNGTISQLEQAKQQISSLQKTPKAKQALEEAITSCRSGVGMGQGACLESTSPHIKEAGAILGGAAGAISAAGGTQAKCSKMGEIMDMASKALTAFNGACGGSKMYCSSSCSKSYDTANTVSSKDCVSEGNSLPDPKERLKAIQDCQAAANSVKSALEGGKKTCSDYSKNLAAGLAGLGGMIKNMMSSDQCKKDTAKDCTANPSDPSCQPEPLDCNKSSNAQNPICICQISPRAQGCGGNLSETGITNPNRDLSKDSSGPGSMLGGMNADDPAAPIGGSPTSQGGGLMGGGGGGGGGAKGGGGTDGSKLGDKKGINTNILSDGGSAGGGGRGFGGSAEAYQKYRGYLPKDKRSLAATMKDGGQVSGSNGLTNWEKVKNRYKEFKPTLLEK